MMWLRLFGSTTITESAWIAVLAEFIRMSVRSGSDAIPRPVPPLFACRTAFRVQNSGRATVGDAGGGGGGVATCWARNNEIDSVAKVPVMGGILSASARPGRRPRASSSIRRRAADFARRGVDGG